MMRFFWIAVLFIGFSVNAAGDSTESQTPTSTQFRRNYPGGKDEGDLTVQNLRKITRKGEEIEPEYHGHAEPVEEGTAPPPGGGFGE